MKLFQCQHCSQPIFFENTLCQQCGHRLGFLPEPMDVIALEPEGDAWRAADGLYRYCANAEHDACNWLVPADSPETLCAACRHNQTIPDMSVAENLGHWRKLEAAKHRLFYSLLRLKLPLANRADDPEHGLAFDVLAEAPNTPRVMTGHDNGLITLALAEADDAIREQTREQMGEPYRTLLGHFRHEVGHHYWDLLVRDGGRLDEFRALFGDESQDYAEALKRNYEEGAPADWRERFVSAYASCHPWEDFAESWAHYLHIVDTLETGFAFGLEIRPSLAGNDELKGKIGFDPYAAGTAERLVESWLPLVFAVNSLNRAMGLPDLYPFVLTPSVIEKLGFIHRLVQGEGQA